MVEAHALPVGQVELVGDEDLGDMLGKPRDRP